MIYKDISGFMACHKSLSGAVAALTKFLPLVCYLLYPAAAVYLLIIKSDAAFRFIIVPAAAFVFCTVVRALINAPRPYEALGIAPIVSKKTKGKSFPSRHCVSSSVIAAAFWYLSRPLGIALCVVAAAIAAVRVLSGVHFIKDVVSGLLLGAAFGVIGFFII
jgi:membrane-associated phospholipid phosphatase